MREEDCGCADQSGQTYSDGERAHDVTCY